MTTKQEMIDKLNQYIDNLTIFRDKINEQISEDDDNQTIYCFNWIEENDGYYLDELLTTGDLSLTKEIYEIKQKTKFVKTGVDENGDEIYKREIIQNKIPCGFEDVIFN